MTILLDSSVIFDILNAKRGRPGYLSQLLNRGHILASCPINFIEVYSGLRDYERPATERFLASLKPYPLTNEVAKLAGLIRRDWKQKGHTLAPMDASLAAVAIHHGLAFMTDNIKHFPMPELHLYPLPND